MSARASRAGLPPSRRHRAAPQYSAVVGSLALLVAAGCGGDGGGTGVTSHRLTVVGGSAAGTGSVSSAPAGIVCSVTGGTTAGTCAADFTAGTVVSLSSAATGGSAFGSWTGACGASANAPTCAVNLSVDLTVAAKFLPAGSTISGFLIVGGPPAKSGILVVSIPTAVFSIARSTGNGSPAAFFGGTPLLASGTLRLVGDTAVVRIVGTIDTASDSRRLCLAQVPPGAADPCAPPPGPWHFDGFLNAVDVVSGTFGGPAGAGTMRMLSTASSTPPVLFCGTLAPPAGGTLSGTLNLAVSATRTTGQATLSGGSVDVDGTVDVAAVSASDGSLFSAAGRLNAARDAITGSWTQQDFNGGSVSGAWTATSRCP